MPTTLLYLEHMDLYNANATVVDVFDEDGRTIVLLDQSIFYPQGGGQPYDTGRITSSGKTFIVEEVRFVDGEVRHIGRPEGAALVAGETVTCHVDAERRALHTRLHSGGHVVDMALRKLGIMWPPGKGYHFPNGPYVEYAGSLTGVDTEKLKQDVESMGNAIIQEGVDTRVLFMPKDNMGSVCMFVPDYLPEHKPARVVMYGDYGVPCGGTHAANLRDIGPLSIRKIKQDGGNIRVSYSV